MLFKKKIENCGICEDYPCVRVIKAFKITKENVGKFKAILSKEEYHNFDKTIHLKSFC